MKRHTRAAAEAALSALVTLCACSTPPRGLIGTQYTATNIVFNPECNYDSSYSMARADWPVTTAFDHQREEISYRETIIDHQGRFGAFDDFPYRRFDSIRIGRTRR